MTKEELRRSLFGYENGKPIEPHVNADTASNFLEDKPLPPPEGSKCSDCRWLRVDNLCNHCAEDIYQNVVQINTPEAYVCLNFSDRDS